MKRTWNSILVILSLLLIFPAMAGAASILVSWNANTESDLAGYIIYTGTQSGVYSSAVDVGKVTSYTLPNVATGKTHYLALTAYDTAGNESGYSTEASVYVPAPTTTPPTPTTPTITVVSPQNGTIFSSAPTMTWKGTGIARYKVFVSKDTRNYYNIYSGTGTSCVFPSSWWRSLLSSGNTVYWYVEGTTSGGKVYKSSRYYFKKR